MDGRGFLITAMLVLASSGLGGCGLKATLSDAFLHPDRAIPARPSDYGLDYEDVVIPTGAGTDVRGWFVPSSRSTGETIVLFHGASTSIGHYHPYVRFLHDGGFHVFLYAYRGYGESRGRTSIDALFEDLNDVLAHVESRADVDPTRIAFFGISLGSIVALRAASEYPRVCAVVVENCVSPDAAVASHLRRSYGAVTRTLITAVLDACVLPWNIEPVDTADDFEAPVFLIQGVEDPVGPSASLAVAEVAGDRAALWIVPGAGHAPDTLDAHEREVRAAIVGFVREVLRDGPPFARVRAGESRPFGDLIETRCEVVPSPVRTGRCAIELALGLANGSIEFRRVWVDRAGEVVPVRASRRVVWAHAHEYRFAIDDGAGGWNPEPSAIREGQQLLAWVSAALGAHGPDRDPSAIAARLDAHGAFHPRVAAELVPSYVAIARRYAANGDVDRAMRFYQRAIDAVPRYPRAHYWIAERLRRIGFGYRADVDAAARALIPHYESTDRPARAAAVRAVIGRLTPLRPSARR